jgi:DNA-directed RNA polymerase subunit N (RpoN/RPB10)
MNRYIKNLYLILLHNHMLFYIKCPSCSRVISMNLDKYYASIKSISDDPKKTKKEKEAAMSKLLNDHGYRHICCRIRIMGLLPYHEIILT